MRPTPSPPTSKVYAELIRLALAEDVGTGDLTSGLVIAEHDFGSARIESRQQMVACGLFVARAVIKTVDSEVKVDCRCAEGEVVPAGTPLIRLQGRLRSILSAERTALNFLGRMSGIATLTRTYLQTIEGTNCQIVDTRKTLPGWRHLDKFAVRVAGGTNHRFGLDDGVLLKDNHIAAAGNLSEAIRVAIRDTPAGIPIQVEVESLAQAEEACQAGASFLLLDNQTPEAVAEIVQELGNRAILEASGGISLDNVADYAATGVHRISLGALTHSPKAADVALEVETEPSR